MTGLPQRALPILLAAVPTTIPRQTAVVQATPLRRATADPLIALRLAVAVLPTAVPPPVAAALLTVAHQAHPTAVRPTAVVDILAEEDRRKT